MKTGLLWKLSCRLLLPAAILFVKPAVGQQSLAEIPPEVLAYADIVLFNGKVLTVDNRFTVAEAVAIRDEKILAVGATPRILKMAGPQTRKIDLAGRTVLPGLIDPHYHLDDYAMNNMLIEEKGIPWEGKLDRMRLHWKDVDMALRDVQKAVRAAPPGELVRMAVFVLPGNEILPQIRMAQLDAISPQNPVMFTEISPGSPIAVNTKALEWAKIPPGTAGLPQDGGILIGAGAARLLESYLTWAIPTEKLIPWHKKMLERVNSWGLTMAVTRINPEQFNALRELWLQKELTVRWRVGFPGPVDYPRTGNVSDIGDDWLRISGSGNMNLGGPDSTLGLWSSKKPLSPPEEAAAVSGWAQARPRLLETLRYGWSIPNSHVKGDIAVSKILDVVEEARKNPIARSSNQRFTMDHMYEVDDRDIERLQKLGIIPSSTIGRDIFSQSALGSDAYEAVLGTEYVNKMFPLKKYLEAGIRPTLEADMGDDVTGKPLFTIEKAVCRCVDGSARVWGRDQKVSREDALRMKTIWAAAYVGDEKILGSIEPGKLADLVVLEDDYLTAPEDQIAEIPVRMTLVGGRIVYQASGSNR